MAGHYGNDPAKNVTRLRFEVAAVRKGALSLKRMNPPDEEVASTEATQSSRQGDYRVRELSRAPRRQWLLYLDAPILPTPLDSIHMPNPYGGREHPKPIATLPVRLAIRRSWRSAARAFHCPTGLAVFECGKLPGLQNLGALVSQYDFVIPVRRPPDLRATSLVILLCLGWGFQQVAMKGVATNVSPVMQLAIRFGGASIFFGSWVLMREGRRAFSDGTLPSGMLLGLMFSLEFIFLGEALSHTTAAHSIVFLYTAPIFTALGLQFLPEERLSRLQWAGIAVAFSGIVVAFLGFSNRSALQVLIGDSLALLGGVSWGLSNVVLRRGRVGSAGTAKTVLYQVATATIVLGGFAWATHQTRIEFSETTILALIFQTAVIAILSYLVWFWLLRRYLTSRLMLLSLLTPVFGVGFGASLLGDPIGLRFAFGTTLVLIGVLIVNFRTILGGRRSTS